MPPSWATQRVTPMVNSPSAVSVQLGEREEFGASSFGKEERGDRELEASKGAAMLSPGRPAWWQVVQGSPPPNTAERRREVALELPDFLKGEKLELTWDGDKKAREGAEIAEMKEQKKTGGKMRNEGDGFKRPGNSPRGIPSFRVEGGGEAALKKGHSARTTRPCKEALKDENRVKNEGIIGKHGSPVKPNVVKLTNLTSPVEERRKERKEKSASGAAAGPMRGRKGKDEDLKERTTIQRRMSEGEIMNQKFAERFSLTDLGTLGKSASGGLEFLSAEVKGNEMEEHSKEGGDIELAKSAVGDSESQRDVPARLSSGGWEKRYKDGNARLAEETAKLEETVRNEKCNRMLLENALLEAGLELPDIRQLEQQHESFLLESEVKWLRAELQALRMHLQLLQLQWIDKLRAEETSIAVLAKHTEELLTVRKHLQGQLNWTISIHELEKQLNDQLEELLSGNNVDMAALASFVNSVERLSPPISPQPLLRSRYFDRKRNNPGNVDPSMSRNPNMSGQSEENINSGTHVESGKSERKRAESRKGEGRNGRANRGSIDLFDISEKFLGVEEANVKERPYTTKKLRERWERRSLTVERSSVGEQWNQSKAGRVLLDLQKEVLRKTKKEKMLRTGKGLTSPRAIAAGERGGMKLSFFDSKLMKGSRSHRPTTPPAGAPSPLADDSFGGLWTTPDLRKRPNDLAEELLKTVVAVYRRHAVAGSATPTHSNPSSPTATPSLVESGSSTPTWGASSSNSFTPVILSSPGSPVATIHGKFPSQSSSVPDPPTNRWKPPSLSQLFASKSSTNGPSDIPPTSPLLSPSNGFFSMVNGNWASRKPLATQNIAVQGGNHFKEGRGGNATSVEADLREEGRWRGSLGLENGGVSESPNRELDEKGVQSEGLAKFGKGKLRLTLDSRYWESNSSLEGEEEEDEEADLVEDKLNVGIVKDVELRQTLEDIAAKLGIKGALLREADMEGLENERERERSIASYASIDSLVTVSASDDASFPQSRQDSAEWFGGRVDLQEVETALLDISGGRNAASPPNFSFEGGEISELSEIRDGRYEFEAFRRKAQRLSLEDEERNTGEELSAVEWTPSPPSPSDPYGVLADHPCADPGEYATLPQLTWLPAEEGRSRTDALLLNRFRELALQLEDVNPGTLGHEEKLAFWLNLYNALLMHTYLVNGAPRNQMRHVSLMSRAAFIVGGYPFNALTIEHSVLRAASHHPPIAKLLPFQRYKNNDERASWVLTQPEPLVSFAMCQGSLSSPAVRVYSPSNIRAELQAATAAYLRAAIGIGRQDVIILPKLLDWYQRDFASSPLGLVEWAARQLPHPLRMALLQRLHRLQPARCLAVAPYCWTFRYLLAAGP